MNLKERALAHLYEVNKPLAVHELRDMLKDVNENNLATRLSEWAREDLVYGEVFKGHAYKIWSITEKGKELISTPKVESIFKDTLFDLNSPKIYKQLR
jgi:DNA-binding HxlR family transcriptional regulator